MYSLTGQAHVTLLVAVLAVVMMIPGAMWVHTDVSKRRARGDSIVLSVGPVDIESPAAWFVVCLLLGEIFIPLYVAARGAG
ncbi:MAG: hypothetical protein JO236_02135 [Mycobacterium sp.]|uniref:hypothetical protein n=1 Tax=Mycobacterium sp. TaxID=1785 RepID=UPI001EBFF5EE|nr:hypothetical protein [Mycobacterium sp.]MBW0016338.1 hypothetical protein [Mycobacterium sp.]